MPIVLTVVAAVVASYSQADRTEVYGATSTIYVGASRFSVDGGASDLATDRVAGLDRLINTFSALIDSEPVARDALEFTDVARSPRQVVNATTVGPRKDTNLLLISVADRDPVVARELATAMAEAFIQKLDALEPGQTVGEGDVPVAPASIFERASLPTVPFTQSVLGSLVVAAIFGFVLSAGVTLLVEYLDVTLKNGDDVEARLELPVLGEVPLNRQIAAGGMSPPGSPRG